MSHLAIFLIERKMMELKKEGLYIVNKRLGQYELTTLEGDLCFFMDDTNEYEYFQKPEIKPKEGE